MQQLDDWDAANAILMYLELVLGVPGVRASTESTPGLAAAESRILIAGGEGPGNNIAVDDAVVFDPNTGAVATLEMTAARNYHTVTRLSATRALIAGGDSGIIAGPGSIKQLSSAEIFDLQSLQFEPTGSMAEARSRHAAAALPDGRVLVTGGLVPTGVGSETIDVASAELFDPATGAFTPTGSMAETRFNHSAMTLDDGRVLVLGGNGRNSAEVHDPASGTFSPVDDMAVNHGLGHQAVRLPDGRVLVLGGDTAAIQPTAVAEVFDPATNQFTRIADMTTPRMLHFAVLVENDGTVLIGGGRDANGELARAELYDPAAGTFTPVEDMPFSATEQHAVSIPE